MISNNTHLSDQDILNYPNKVPSNKYILSINGLLSKNYPILFDTLACLRRSGREIDLVCVLALCNKLVDLNSQYAYAQKVGVLDLVHFVSLKSPYSSSYTCDEFIKNCLLLFQLFDTEGLDQIIQQGRMWDKSVIIAGVQAVSHYDYSINFSSMDPSYLAKKIFDLTLPSLSETAQCVIANSTINDKEATKDPPITIATTIAPLNLANQKMAITTWLQHGFRVVSINTSQEISQYKTYFPEIEFIEAKNNASTLYGKPFIFLDDFFSFFQQQDSPICGIINSDIFLHCKKLCSFLAKEAVNSFIFGPRVDIPTLNAKTGTLNQWGFDYFFFDRRITYLYPEKAGYCLGLPLWDFWLPLIAIENQIPIKKLETPIAYHINHIQNYSESSLVDFGYRLARHFFPSFNVCKSTMERFGYLVRERVKQRTKQVQIN